ncbi:MAG TPA: D-amino-acid transaminase [Paracoccaceae bacterium]|nr:D-amino-acid transaminase [Paracoccaceae bacterium]
MSRTVYVNGDYLPEEDAKISVFDRGFLMADAVYEVTAVLDGRLCDFDGHRARLHRSLSELEMALPVSDDELLEIHRELVRRNDLTEGGIYLQVTRGEADRDFVWPKDATPGMVLFTQARPVEKSETAKRGIKVVPVEDERWGRRDIKTVQLLFPSWAKMQAKRQGADDAWLVEDGFVTEGTSNNAYIVRDGVIVTRQLSNDILHGITRASVLKLAEEAQMRVQERPFTIEEAQGAQEAFITSASQFVCPVVEIDGKPVGSGTPGPVAKRLREIYVQYARDTAI